MLTVNPNELAGQDLSDRLRLGELRGQGTYGWVFAGDLLSLGRSIGRCCVKLCQVSESESADTVLKEMRDCSRWLHPRLMLMQSAGVVRLGPATGLVYVTSELADMSLQDILDRGELLDPDEAHTMLEQVAEALAYLHDQRLTHGEVRPANILRTAAGTWKLSGMEFRPPTTGRLEELGPTEHLFVYRAPETFEAPVESSAVDVWALGVIAHASLTGRLPFAETPGLSRGDMIWRILNRDPEPEHLPEPIYAMVRGCLRKNPEDRWTAERVVQCLQGDFEPPPEPEEEPLEVGDPGPPVEPPPPPPPDRKPVGMAIALGVVVCGLLGGLMMAANPVKKQPNVLPGDLVPWQFYAVHLDTRGRASSQALETSCIVEQLEEDLPLELIQIPQGEFIMGAPQEEIRREADEGPLHRVKIDAAYMARTEITQAQWAAVAAMPAVNRRLPEYPSRTRGSDTPVNSVSWAEAVEFCERLTQKTGRYHRLPTEAEWEYACRGGTVTAFGFGPTLTTEVANFRGSRPYTPGSPEGLDRLHALAAGYFPVANAYGLQDMHGSVWEWCEDFYAPYTGAPANNPAGPAEGYNRVVRGGGFRSFAWNCRSAARSHAHPEQRRTDLGFRVLVPAEVEVQP